ncbi:MAG: hypothetical protein ACRERV_05745, partial [Methylococcales bacterium]
MKTNESGNNKARWSTAAALGLSLLLLVAPVHAVSFTTSFAGTGNTENPGAGPQNTGLFGSAVDSSHSIGGDNLGFSGSSSSFANVNFFPVDSEIAPDIRLKASADFAGNPVIGTVAEASGQYRRRLSFIVSSGDLPVDRLIYTQTFISLQGDVDATGDTGFRGNLFFGGVSFNSGDNPEVFFSHSILPEELHTSTLQLVGVGFEGLTFEQDLDVFFSIIVRAGGGGVNVGEGDGRIVADYSTSVTLLGFNVTDTDGNPVPVTIVDEDGFTYRQLNRPGVPRPRLSNPVAIPTLSQWGTALLAMLLTA